MYSVVSILVLIVSVLLVILVLVQNSKGGGLASNFSGSNSFMGVRKTTDFVEKATWTLAGALLILSFVSVMVLPKEQSRKSLIDSQVEKLPTQQQAPSFPAPTSAPAPANNEGAAE